MKKSLISFICLILSACSLAPSYHRPRMPIPLEYKENKDWKPAKPQVLSSRDDRWWQIFHDETLNKLEARLSVNNQNLKVAIGRYFEAKALLQITGSELYPTILGIGNANRVQTSRNIANIAAQPRYNDFLLATNLSYEIDLWGRVRNAVSSAKNRANASESDLVAVALSLHAELAQNYFSLRGNEQAQNILDKTVKAYEKALYLTKQRHKGGAAPIADVDEAETQLETAKTLAADLRLKRAQLENAIAVLIGDIPSNFRIARKLEVQKMVNIAPSLPSTLVERRPDVVAAELRVRAANADIGVARAAFFPQLNLNSILGFESKSIAKLLSKPSLLWSLGPINAVNLNQPMIESVIFDGGRLMGFLESSKASYIETVGTYRQTVLTAFQEVEDSLVAIKRLDEENQSQTKAAIAANNALTQARYRYQGGIITYLDVVVSENIALQADLSAVDIRTRRQLATVQLIKALGGGWNCKKLCCN
ncbi:MAG: efflux transporter outer membrane subunit [Proteobacteria bacterium]|nr:efflux transporter outer membrane subunit [Pseudomonadota bacterium]